MKTEFKTALGAGLLAGVLTGGLAILAFNLLPPQTLFLPHPQDCAPIPGTPYMTCCLPDMTCTVVQRPGSVSPSSAGTCAQALIDAAVRDCPCKTNASLCPLLCETILKENCTFMTIEHALLANSDASSGND